MKSLVIFAYTILLTTAMNAGFFLSAQQHLACQYACSLLPNCSAGPGSFCDEAGSCSGVRQTSEGVCFDDCEEDAEALSCDEAVQGLIAAVTRKDGDPVVGGEEEGVFNFIPHLDD